MPGALTNSMATPRIDDGAPAAAPPGPGWFDGAGASTNVVVDDIGVIQKSRIFKAYDDLEDALVSAGQDRSKYRTPFWQRILSDDPSALYDKDAIWADVMAVRQRDPKAFASLPQDREAFERYVLNREGRSQKDAETASRAHWSARFAGGMVGSFVDPINLATLPIGGGGKTVIQTMAREGVLNALIETIQQPFLARNMARRGEGLTPEQAAANIAFAGVGGAVFGGGLHVAGKYAGPVRDAALAKIYQSLPDSVRDRFLGIEEVPDSALADLLEQTLGRDNLTPDEISALHVLRREDEIAATNPFVRNGAGIEAHADNLRLAMERILSDAPSSAPMPGLPGLRSSTAIASGTVDMSPRATVKRRIAVVENATGSNTARPIGADGKPLSSALGKYQFTAGTWNSLYKRRFGDQGLTDAQIAAKRTDPRLQDLLMDDLMSANGAALRRAGQAETPGNLYLAHFAGADGAARLLGADPTARAVDVLGDAAARANPWMRDMSAHDLIRWAERKMGQAYPSPRSGERVEIAGGDPEDVLQRQLQGELDRLEGERLALEQGGERQPVIDPGDVEPVPVDLGDALPLPAAPRRRAEQRTPMDLFQFIASKGGIVDNEGHDLRGMFDRNPFVPRYGPLLRQSGMSLDRARELAVEAGYFGDPSREDFTVADLLDALDRQARGQERIYVGADLSEVEARRQKLRASEGFAEFDQRLHGAAVDRGIDDLADDDVLRAFELYDGDFEATLDRVIGEHLDQAHMDFLAETDPTLYDQMRRIEESGYGDRRFEDGQDPGWADEPEFVGGNPRQDGEGPADGGGPATLSRSAADAEAGLEATGYLPESEQARWDEPDGQGTEWQAESLDHDFRAETGAPDPNIGERQRQEAQLRAEAPLRGSSVTGKDQDGTMGLDLFDAADQPGFRLDEEGDVVNPADLLADLDVEEAAIKGIEDCL